MATRRDGAQASCGVRRRLSRIRRARRSTTPPRCIERRRGARHSPQELPAELQGVRREALLQARRRSPRWSTTAASASACWSARTSGSPSPRSSRVPPAPRCSWCSTPRRTRSTSSANARTSSRRCVRELGLPVVYVNMLGGQDELVFDGNSFVMDGAGKVVMRAPPFEEGLYTVEFERVDGVVRPVPTQRRARARRRRERVSRARARRARLRRQARLSRRRAWGCRAASIPR